MNLLKSKNRKPFGFWLIFGTLILGILNSSSYQKEEAGLSSFAGSWKGVFQEYELQADTSIKVMEWTFDLTLHTDGTGSFGRSKPLFWHWDEKQNTMRVLIKDNPGGSYPDIETLFSIQKNTADRQIWSYAYQGRARMEGGVEIVVPVERVWRLEKKR